MAEPTFLGATERVTGSAYFIKTRQTTVLLECGLIQGDRDEDMHSRDPFPLAVEELDAVMVLSHAHLDHSGRIPLLRRSGFYGPVSMTRATFDLIEVMLKDAAMLNERDVQWENTHRRLNSLAVAGSSCVSDRLDLRVLEHATRKSSVLGDMGSP